MLANYLLGRNDYQFIFDAKSFTKEIVRLLQRDDILKRDEVIKFYAIQCFAALCVMSIMHESTFIYEGKDVRLSVTNFTGELCVHAYYEYGKTAFAAPIFRSFCKAADHLDPSLLGYQSLHSLALEVGGGGKLVAIEAC